MSENKNKYINNLPGGKYINDPANDEDVAKHTYTPGASRVVQDPVKLHQPAASYTPGDYLGQSVAQPQAGYTEGYRVGLMEGEIKGKKEIIEIVRNVITGVDDGSQKFVSPLITRFRDSLRILYVAIYNKTGKVSDYSKQMTKALKDAKNKIDKVKL